MLPFPVAISTLPWRPRTSLKQFKIGLPGVLLAMAFAPDTWQTAKRITLLINHLWSLAELETLPPALQRERLHVLWAK